MNEYWEKPQKCMCMSSALALFFQPWEDLSLTLQLDTVIIEVSSVKGLSLRGITTETIQGQIFAINELELWWHRTLQWLN